MSDNNYTSELCWGKCCARQPLSSLGWVLRWAQGQMPLALILKIAAFFCGSVCWVKGGAPFHCELCGVLVMVISLISSDLLGKLAQVIANANY